MIFIEKPPLTLDGKGNTETIYLSYINDIQSLLTIIRELNRVSKEQVLPLILQHIINKEEVDDILTKNTIATVLDMAKQLDTIEISPRVREMGELEHYKKNIKIVVVFTETYKTDCWWKKCLPLTTENTLYMNKSIIMTFLRKLVSAVLPNVKNSLFIVTSKHDIFKSNNIYKIHEKIKASTYVATDISGYICFPKRD
jgi:hypothetical protein